MKPTRPVIGITSSMEAPYIRMNRSYFDAVLASGGIPLYLPYSGGRADAEKFLSLCDGVIFGGGADIEPSHYGEEITGEGVECVPLRDEFELELARLLRASSIPVFGICRGIQLMNVACGGSLFQDIKNHRQNVSGDIGTQTVTLKEDSLIRSICKKDKISVNSFHHQSVKAVAPDFVATAFFEDGSIEAIEPKEKGERFVLGVQWHPELLYFKDESAKALFDAFVLATKANIK